MLIAPTGPGAQQTNATVTPGMTPAMAQRLHARNAAAPAAAQQAQDVRNNNAGKRAAAIDAPLFNTPPPLPPRPAALDASAQQGFAAMQQETQAALEQCCGSAAALAAEAPAAVSAGAPSVRLLAALGNIDSMTDARMMAAFVLLSMHGHTSLRDAQVQLLDISANAQKRGMAQQKATRQAQQQLLDKLAQRQYRRRLVGPAMELASLTTVAIGAASLGGMAIVLVGAGMAAGAAAGLGRSLWQGGSHTDAWRHAQAGVRGALAGAAVVSLGSLALSAVHGTAWLGVSAGHSGNILYVRAVTGVATAAAEIVLGVDTLRTSRMLSAERQMEAQNRGLRLSVDALQQQKQALLDYLAALVQRRGQTVNQIMQLLGSKYQAQQRIIGHIVG